MSKMQDLQKKSEAELAKIVEADRETIRAERFKDKFSRKAGVIRGAKKEIARVLTELSARRRNSESK